jgi:hypothetical protein
MFRLGHHERWCRREDETVADVLRETQ